MYTYNSICHALQHWVFCVFYHDKKKSFAYVVSSATSSSSGPSYIFYMNDTCNKAFSCTTRNSI